MSADTIVAIDFAEHWKYGFYGNSLLEWNGTLKCKIMNFY